MVFGKQTRFWKFAGKLYSLLVSFWAYRGIIVDIANSFAVNHTVYNVVDYVFRCDDGTRLRIVIKRKLKPNPFVFARIQAPKRLRTRAGLVAELVSRKTCGRRAEDRAIFTHSKSTANSSRRIARQWLQRTRYTRKTSRRCTSPKNSSLWCIVRINHVALEVTNWIIRAWAVLSPRVFQNIFTHGTRVYYAPKYVVWWL